MKRKNVRSLFCLILVLSLLMSLAACTSNQEITSSGGNTTGTQKKDELGGSFCTEAQLAMKKMSQPTALRSDIVAGIDHSSIVEEGNTTFFCSTMSDGTVVRFEGTDISISEDGITINPGSQIVSLDAVGKIYIYYATVKDADRYQLDASGAYNVNLDVGFGYTYRADKTSVERAADVHTYGLYSWSPLDWENGNGLSVAYFEPNYIYFSGSSYNAESCVVSSLTVGYDPTEKVTAISDMSMDAEMSHAYMEGDQYDPSKENAADEETGKYDFYLLLKPDVKEADKSVRENWIQFIPYEFYATGDLKDASGNVLDKQETRVQKGTTLEITVGDYCLPVELPIQEKFEGANTMNDLVPFAFPTAIGNKNTLVVPVVWADQMEMANETQRAMLQKALGRVMGADGKLVDHSVPDDGVFSLSEYFDIASYGKLAVNCFMTDWYYTDKTFAEHEFVAPKKDYVDEILEWVKGTYTNLDWTQFDQDGNGYVDSMVIINLGQGQEDWYDTTSYGGAIHYRESYFGDYAGTQTDPNINCFVTINQRFLEGGQTGTLIHEFSHNFGIIDYYDVTYSGINAVGGFDMQSDNVGDWNAYSKLAVGWMDPKVVVGLASGTSVELDIRSSALTGDVILLPAAGTAYGGPFGEYVMIDLFSDDGVNVYDTAGYGLQGVAGVRISHINAIMEKRTMEVPSMMDPWKSAIYDIGTVHYANAYSGQKGYYNIEVIQSGKVNTFTDLSNEITNLTATDLFYAGDTFSAEEYSEFFYEGLMDNGMELGYTVTIVSVGTDADGIPTATIRITAK